MDRVIIDEVFQAGDIVCLIGSSRFKSEFEDMAYKLETSGILSLAMGFFQHGGSSFDVTPEQREILYKIDKKRIDLCNKVLVMNCLRLYCSVCGQKDLFMHCQKACYNIPYIGEDTQKEIDYAIQQGKPIYYLWNK